MSIDSDSMRQIVAGAQQGDRLAADQLIRDHDPWVRSAIYAVTGRPDLVDDVSQQVWTRVWERLITLKNPGRLRSWLYAIARNAAIDASVARRAQQQLSDPLDPATAAAQAITPPDQVVTGRELRETLLQAVRSLPALYREPFVLRHLENWSYAEIGDVLEVPADTVETRLVRARRMLRESLQGKVES